MGIPIISGPHNFAKNRTINLIGKRMLYRHEKSLISSSLFILLTLFLFISGPSFSQGQSANSIEEKIDEAILLESNGNYIKAIDLLNQVAPEIESTGSHSDEYLDVILLLGQCYNNIGNQSLAIKSYSECLKRAKKEGDMIAVVDLYNSIGASYTSIAEYQQGRSYYSKALRVARNEKDTFALASTYQNLGGLFEDQDSNQLSLKYYKLALIEYTYLAREEESFDLDDRYYEKFVGQLQNNVGFILTKLGRYDEAKQYCQKGLEIYQRRNDKVGIGLALDNFARIEDGKGNLDKAIELYLQSIDYLENSEYIHALDQLYLNLSEAYGKKGRLQRSIDAYKKHVEFVKLIEEGENKKALLNYQFELVNEKRALRDSLNHSISLKNKELQVQSEKAKSRFWIAIGVITMILAIAIILFLRYQAQKRMVQKELETKDQLVAAIVAGQEQERKRISQELHDGIGSELVAAKFKLISESAQEAYEIIERTIGEIRDLSHDLIPPRIEEHGIEQSIGQHILTVQKAAPFKVYWGHIGNFDSLKPEEKSALYRITQECISNVIKYAEATELSVQLIEDEGIITLLIEDDGIGFDVNQKASGIGLANIKSRTEVLQGTFSIDSSRGHGTTIVVEFKP